MQFVLEYAGMSEISLKVEKWKIKKYAFNVHFEFLSARKTKLAAVI